MNMDGKVSLITIIKLSAIIDILNGILYAVGDDDYMKSIGEEISEKHPKQ